MGGSPSAMSGVGQIGNYAGQPSGNLFTGGTPLKQPQNNVGSSLWASTHPGYKPPATGVGSADWMSTHPNYGGQQMGQPQQPAQTPFGLPQQQAQFDISDAFKQMFGGAQGGGGGGYGFNWML